MNLIMKFNLKNKTLIKVLSNAYLLNLVFNCFNYQIFQREI